MITPAFNLTATERVLPRLALDWTTGLPQSSVDVARVGVATFVGSDGLIQLASANTQRIDWFTGTAGLLVEESTQNKITYSADFSNVIWSPIGTTATSSVVVSPDGVSNAFFLKETSSVGNHTITQSMGGLAANTYTFSVFFNKNPVGSRNIGFAPFNTGAAGGTGSKSVIVDSSGNFVGFVGTGVDPIYSVTDFGDYCRISVTGNSTNFATLSPTIRLAFGTTISYTGDNTSGFYVWGAQFEQKGFATSYIPTEATAVTRNADVATITGTNFSNFFNAEAGTFFIQSNARSGDDLLTAGSYVLTADATALKKYATTYSVDTSATQLDIGKGLHQKIMYYPHDLIAAELAALTA